MYWIAFNFLPALIILLMLLVPGVALLYLLRFDRHQHQHSVMRNYPILGRLRYLLESAGPELRQYLFDADNGGKPFSRDTFADLVRSAKYASTLIGFGSKRDFAAAGFYIRNALFPRQVDELRVDNETKVPSRVYRVESEGLFSRREQAIDKALEPWLLPAQDAIVIGPQCPHPFIVHGQVGMSAMSYGALGDHAHRALAAGLALAGGAWVNTGEGGIAACHLSGGGDVIAQIGPGRFGYLTPDGQFDWDELRRKAEHKQIRAFELKLGQGAKIRGGHLPGEKVNLEIAAIRTVRPWQDIDSPNRFHEFHDVPSLVGFIDRIRAVTGKPVGIKVVIGAPGALADLCRHMVEHGGGPDFITIDGCAFLPRASWPPPVISPPLWAWA